MKLSHQLYDSLRRLKLPGMVNNLDLRAAEAKDNKLGYIEFLTLLIQDEVSNRESNNLQKRIRLAGFGDEKTFEGYDFNFNEEALPSSAIRDLAACHFVEKKQNVVIAGPPGIGKSHISAAIGHELCRRGMDVIFSKTNALLQQLLTALTPRIFEKKYKKIIKADLLILDDFGFRRFDQKESEILYSISDERLAKRSTILTSNRPPEDWYSIFPDPVIGQAILDRLLSGSIKIITTKGRSYRKERGCLLNNSLTKSKSDM